MAKATSVVERTTCHAGRTAFRLRIVWFDCHRSEPPRLVLDMQCTICPDIVGRFSAPALDHRLHLCSFLLLRGRAAAPTTKPPARKALAYVCERVLHLVVACMHRSQVHAVEVSRRWCRRTFALSKLTFKHAAFVRGTAVAAFR